MGIALFSFENVSARLRAAWQAWSGHPGTSGNAHAGTSKGRMPGWRCVEGLRVSREPHAARSVRPRPARAADAVHASQAATTPRPLRVVQVLEQHPAPAGARARHWNGPARAGSTADAGAPAANGGAANAQASAPSPGNGVRAAGLVASRIVISGRLADVCAELERLAALEGDGAQALLPTR